jgi:uncharacterized protein
MSDDGALRDRLLPGELTHNVIILSGWMGRVPAPLMVLLCLVPALFTAQVYAACPTAAAVLAVATVTDALLLWSLPRLGLSFGPVQGPLVVFSLGRHLLALILAALFALVASPQAWEVGVLVALQGTLTACSLWGHLVAPFAVRVQHVRAPILAPRVGGAELPRRTARIVLLTDLHVERITRRERRVLRMVDDLAPDLVLFGGDLLNLSYVQDDRALADARSFMETLLARHDLRVVLGNPTVEVRHVVRPFWESLGVTPLDGTSESMVLGGARIRLRLYGLPASRSLTKDARRLATLMADQPPSPTEASVLLYHLPDLAHRTPPVDLYLAGHTHGGQIRLPLIGPIFTASGVARRLAKGTHQLSATLLHTSRGLGMEGAGAPRMRFLCPPEVTLVELCEATDPSERLP